MAEDVQKNILSNNLLKYLAVYDKSQKEVADAIGVSPQTFNTWCQGIALPRMGKLQLLADYFHINKSDLIEMKEPAAQDDLALREDELELLRMYNNISESHQKDLLAAARVFETSDNLQSGVSDLSGDGDILDDKESEDGIA